MRRRRKRMEPLPPLPYNPLIIALAWALAILFFLMLVG